MAIDPVCKMNVEEAKAVATSEYKGKTYYFCAVGCKKAFDQDQEQYLAEEKKQSWIRGKVGDPTRIVFSWTSMACSIRYWRRESWPLARYMGGGLIPYGPEVFRVDGPGGEHFFYNSMESGEEVIWLTVEAADALPILEEALKTF